MSLIKKLYLSIALCLIVITASYSNNLQITNLQVIANHKLTFTISWENSWNLDSTAEPNNHDAVWIFLKYRDNSGTWQHLDLSSNVSDHQSDSLTIETVTDGKGVFLKKKSKGSSNFISANVTLNWTTTSLSGNFDFKVFGTEMVWIPHGSFYIGDGASNNSLSRGDKNAPYFVQSENTIKIGEDSLSLIDTGTSAPAANIPLPFPKGYNGFYCMKYEITQEQYVDFLNCLSYNQQAAHITASPTATPATFALGTGNQNRNGIVIETSGKSDVLPAVFASNASGNSVYNDAADGQNRGCNFLNWNDLAAYLQWAALRPMTELEFEKICRGPKPSVKQEFAWGTPYSIDANTLINDGTDTERVKENPGADTGIASYGYAGPQGPLRAGFAANQSSDRLKAGASYYGAMEMSGDLWEMCIVLTKSGLNFTGISGNGNLSDSGFANIQGWPGTDCNGAGHKGGAFNSGIAGQFRDLAISDRFYVATLPTVRRNTTGGRGVR